VAFFFSTVTTLIAGTVFPISVLPAWLRYISYSIPLTPALQGLRLALLNGVGLGGVLWYVFVLLIYDLVLLPMGVAVYTYGFNRARRDGTLSEY
jgi:ABC-2 type transport system permease protein